MTESGQDCHVTFARLSVVSPFGSVYKEFREFLFLLEGGYFALWLAATGQVQAGVSYYGALTGAGTDRSLDRFRQAFTNTSSPVLILHGVNDSTVPIGKAKELDGILTMAKTPHAFYPYAGADHRFERSGGDENEAAAADAWQQTQAFLNKILKE
jgi:dienelactone hydrolase